MRLFIKKMLVVFSFLGRRTALLAAIAVPLLGATSAVNAAPGDLDPSFGVNGLATLTNSDFVGPFYGVAIQPDGKIVAVGGGVVPYSSSAPYLVRYNGDGSLDSGFGSGGKVLIDPWGGFSPGLAVQGDGTILTGLNNSVVRYSANGILETNFPNDLQPCLHYGSCIYAIVIQPDGRLLVATQSGLVRYNSDGTYDSSFGNSGMAPLGFEYRAISLQSDGKIVASGGISGDILVVRYNADGTPDPTFGSNGGIVTIPNDNNGGANSVGVQLDGKIIIISNSHRYIVPYPAPVQFFVDLRRFNIDGTLDSGFGSGGLVETPVTQDSYAWALTLQSDGNIVAVGQSLGQGIFMARYNTDGSPDTQFGTGGMVTTGTGGTGNAIALQTDGKIVVAGWWTDNSSSGPTVARYMADNSPLNNTPTGNNVNVALGNGVKVTFSSVTVAGNTSVTTSSTGPTPPAGFQTGNPSIYYDIQTTATYTPPVVVCITYNPADYGDPNLAQLFHYEAGAWTNVTTSNDTVNYIICGQSSSLSPFAIMTSPPFQAQVQQPINSDGSSVFNASRGVVPVKFTLSAGGQSTCALPTATIAVFRTGGATDQPITESVYSMAADNGSFFRITGCQYLYNLNSKALGKGSYLVQILINNSVVGSTTFHLK